MACLAFEKLLNTLKSYQFSLLFATGRLLRLYTWCLFRPSLLFFQLFKYFEYWSAFFGAVTHLQLLWQFTFVRSWNVLTHIFRYTNAWSVFSTMQGWWKFWGSAVSSLHRILLVCWYWRLGDWRNKDQRNAKLQEKYWICFVEVYLHVYSFWVIMSDTALNGYACRYTV